MQLSDLKKAMKGVGIVQLTPFNKDGSLDLEGMRANTRWLLEHTAGKDFIFTPMGSTGEFYAMGDDERKAVIKMVVEEVKGKNVIVAGAAHAGTPETIKMCQYAESVGADGVQVVLPYYHVPTEEGMYQHYKKIAESVSIGIMVYNFPGPTGSWIKPPLMAKLSKIPNIIAVKENTPFVHGFRAMQGALDPKDTVVLCGTGELMFSFMAIYGCPGFISSVANWAPDLSYSIYEAATARDFGKLAELVNSLAPYDSFVAKVAANHGPNTGIGKAGGNMHIGVIKAALDIIYLRGGEPRLPLVSLNKEEKDELSSILKTML
ncbi:4-hydroxy-tetrahydrodipicolinate synthase [subsurface metagenome]